MLTYINLLKNNFYSSIALSLKNRTFDMSSTPLVKVCSGSSHLQGAAQSSFYSEHLNDIEIIDSREKLSRLFRSFNETIKELDISPDIYCCDSAQQDDPEVSVYRVLIKNIEEGRGFYCEGKAALFVVEMDGDTTIIRYGFGACGTRGCMIDKASGVIKNYKGEFIQALVIEEEFTKFLDLVLPTVKEWDKIYSSRLFRLLKEGERIPSWLSIKMLKSYEGNLVTVSGYDWRKENLIGMVSDGEVELLKEQDRYKLV